MDKISKSFRLKELRLVLELKQEVFGEKIGVSQPNIAQMESGNRPIGKRISNDIIREFNVNPEWFESGEGEMFLSNETTEVKEDAVKYNRKPNEEVEKSKDVPVGYVLVDKDELLKLYQQANKSLERELEFYKK